MTKLKGFPKNRYDRPNAIWYSVKFESGWTERVLAKSNYEAKNKTVHLCCFYGHILSAVPDEIY